MEIEKIPEFTKKEVEALKSAGITKIEELVGMTKELLSQLTGFSIEKSVELIRKSWKYYQPEIVSANKYGEERYRIETPFPTLNKLFGGGIPTGTLTQFYGSFGSGKSQILFTQSVLEASKGNLVLFIDTERTFSKKRLLEITENRGFDTSILENIKLITTPSSNELMILVAKLGRVISEIEEQEGKKVRLISIDSVVAPFRSDYVGLDELVERQQKLNWVLRNLLRLSEVKDFAVMFSNQVVAAIGSHEKFVPVGGYIATHICVSPNTLVVTDNGIKTIEELQIGDTVLGFSGSEISFSKVIDKAETYHKTTYLVNDTLEMSPEHRVFVVDGIEIKEKCVKDLKEGDYLVYPNKINVPVRKIIIPEFEDRRVYVIKNGKEVKEKLRKVFPIKRYKECMRRVGVNPRQLRGILNSGYLTTRKVIEKIKSIVGEENVEYEVKETHKHKNYREVRVLTKELAQFLGYFVGDGNTTFVNGIRIRDRDVDVLRHYGEIVKKVFGINYVINKVSKNCYELVVYSKYMEDVLRYLMSRIYDIFYEEEEVIKAFLRGIFDAEGSVQINRGRPIVSIGLGKNNKNFLIFLKLLLMRLGIMSGRIRKCGNGYAFYVNNTLFRDIGFTAKRKAKRLNKAFREPLDSIPVPRRTIRDLLKKMGIKWERSHYHNFIRREELEELCRDGRVKELLGHLLNFNYEKVRSIKVVRKPVRLIDIETVFGNFFANGFLVHNSNNIFKLLRWKQRKRVLRIYDVPFLPEMDIYFKITKKGVEEIKKEEK